MLDVTVISGDIFTRSHINWTGSDCSYLALRCYWPSRLWPAAGSVNTRSQRLWRPPAAADPRFQPVEQHRVDLSGQCKGTVGFLVLWEGHTPTQSSDGNCVKETGVTMDGDWHDMNISDINSAGKVFQNRKELLNPYMFCFQLTAKPAPALSFLICLYDWYPDTDVQYVCSLCYLL